MRALAAAFLLLCGLGLWGCVGHVQGNRDIQRGDYASAVARLSALIQDHPRMRGPRIDLGRAYLHQGEDLKAQEQFLAVLAEAPGDWQATYWLGVLRIVQGRASQGMEYLQDNLSIPFRLYMTHDVLNGTAALARRNLGRVEFLDRAWRLLADAELRAMERERNSRR